MRTGAIIAALAWLCVSCACNDRRETTPPPMDQKTRSALDGIVDDLAVSANTVNMDLAERHLMLDDERFSEIEDFIPEPVGANVVLGMHEWARKNGKPGDNVRFKDRKYYRLTEDVAYATAVQHLNFDKPGRSRVTFVFLRKGGFWKVIHAHYSTMPKKEE